MMALKSGHGNVVQILLDHGAEMNIHGRKIRPTAFQSTSPAGAENMMRMILDYEAAVNSEAEKRR